MEYTKAYINLKRAGRRMCLKYLSLVVARRAQRVLPYTT